MSSDALIWAMGLEDTTLTQGEKLALLMMADCTEPEYSTTRVGLGSLALECLTDDDGIDQILGGLIAKGFIRHIGICERHGIPAFQLLGPGHPPDLPAKKLKWMRIKPLEVSE